MKKMFISTPITQQILVSNGQRAYAINESESLAKALIQTSKAGPTCDSNHEINLRLRDKLIDVAEEMVNQLFESNIINTGPHKPHQLPKLPEFIKTVVRRTDTSLASILIALTYLFRLKQRHPGCKGTYGSGHRLLLASIMIASKYLHDDAYHNKSWASVCIGVFTIREINKMEMELLLFLDFKLYVSREYWSKFVTQIDGRLSHSDKYSVIADPGLSNDICLRINDSVEKRNAPSSTELTKLDCTQLPMIVFTRDGL